MGDQRDSLFPESQTTSAAALDAQESIPRPSQSIRSHSQQQPPSTLAKPTLRTAASFAPGRSPVMETVSPPRSEASINSPRQRYSDEAANAAKGPKKKSGFSSFVNNLVGSPRRPQISAPENPVHVTHVGYNYDTGEFTVRFISLFPRNEPVLTRSTRVFQRNGRESSKMRVYPSKSKRPTPRPSSMS